MTTQVTLVVPVRDEASTLDALLRSIEAQTRAPDHDVFVDFGVVEGDDSLVGGVPAQVVRPLGERDRDLVERPTRPDLPAELLPELPADR